MHDTIFDGILAGTVPADVVFENDHVLAFRDIAPQAPVHVLVIPRTRMTSLAEGPEHPPEALGHFLQGVALVARHLDLEENGYRVVFNTGRNGQQTVEYVHAHILGGRKLTWPPG